MSVTSADIKFRKSVVQTDTDTNGGRKGIAQVVSGARHALFPRVTKSQRENGLIRYRKQFYCNENASDQTAYGVLIYLMRPSSAEDRFYLAKGTQLDTQGQFKRKTSVSEYATSRYDRVWTGCGELAVALTGGEASVQLTMESDDFQFPNGGYLYLSENTMTSQTVDSDVVVGNSVEYSGGSWSKIAHSNDITYPKGWFLGDSSVLSIEEGANEEFLQLADNATTGEVIGTGDGTATAPALSTLTNNTNGICRQPEKLPVIKATCDGTERTVNVAADGSCSGYCSAGQLNMATGAWTTNITWNTAPDDTENITANYHENCYSYSGSTVTVELSGQVAGAFDVASTFGSGCIYMDEVACAFSNWDITSTSGTYDDTTYPLVLHNKGTVQEDWVLSFTSSTNFSVSGGFYGTIGTGSIGSTFAPINPDTGVAYFTLNTAGWGGTWANGDTVSFTTSPSALPILLEEEVPTGTTQEPNNLLALGSYTE